MYMMGIINSRRLGKSLGLDIIGADGTKRCNMNCVYCEVGNGTYLTKRGIYSDYEAVEQELRTYMDHEFDVVTFSGNGEPTLNTDIGRYIDLIHKLTKKPVCVITNSTTLGDPDVVEALNKAEIVMPSIDAVSQKIFDKVDRGFRLDVEKIKKDILTFAKQYKGKLFIEALLVKGYNDNILELKALAKYLKQVPYAEFHLNTVDRLPAEDIPYYQASDKEELLHFFQREGLQNIRIF